jgi:hypothetical protein
MLTSLESAGGPLVGPSPIDHHVFAGRRLGDRGVIGAGRPAAQSAPRTGRGLSRPVTHPPPHIPPTQLRTPADVEPQHLLSGRTPGQRVSGDRPQRSPSRHPRNVMAFPWEYRTRYFLRHRSKRSKFERFARALLKSPSSRLSPSRRKSRRRSPRPGQPPRRAPRPCAPARRGVGAPAGHATTPGCAGPWRREATPRREAPVLRSSGTLVVGEDLEGSGCPGAPILEVRACQLEARCAPGPLLGELRQVAADAVGGGDREHPHPAVERRLPARRPRRAGSSARPGSDAARGARPGRAAPRSGEARAGAGASLPSRA